MQAITNVLWGLSALLYAVALVLLYIRYFLGAPDQTAVEFIIFASIILVPGWLVGKARFALSPIPKRATLT